MMTVWLMNTVLLGLGASLIMDGWAVVRRLTTGAPLLDYGWLTRWLAGLPEGRLSLSPGREAPLSTWERVIGWALHYGIGIGYAVLFLSVAGQGWVSSPSVTSALLFGGITALAPFLILQPALGRGVFAARTPSPWSARIQTLLTHLIFGLGLYATALGMVALNG